MSRLPALSPSSKIDIIVDEPFQRLFEVAARAKKLLKQFLVTAANAPA